MRIVKRAALVALGSMVLALPVSAAAGPITCPGDLTATHNGGSGWTCTSPSGNPTGAGWHKGTGDKL